jgi:hypothetical protein
VHPIERLRAVARSSGAEQGLLVRETAGAMAALGDDPAGLVTASRRILERHPAAGALWWLCARVLTAGDPVAEAWRAVDDLDDDPTPAEVVAALPDGATVCVLGWPEVVADALPRRGDVTVLVVDALGDGPAMVRRLTRADVPAVDVPAGGLGAAAAEADLVLLEANAVGPAEVAAVSGSLAAAAVARHRGAPVWLTVPRGRLLPARLWDALARRVDLLGDPWDADVEVVPVDLVDRVVGPAGVVDVATALRAVDCPVAPELTR